MKIRLTACILISLLAVLIFCIPANAQTDNTTDNGTRINKAFVGVAVQVVWSLLPPTQFNLVMAFTSDGKFFNSTDVFHDGGCFIGSYTMNKSGHIKAVFDTWEGTRVTISFQCINETLIGLGKVVMPMSSDSYWPFPLYYFVFIGRHTTKADSRMEEILNECTG